MSLFNVNYTILFTQIVFKLHISPIYLYLMLVYLRYTTKEGFSIEIHKGESLDPLFSKIPINKHLLKAVLKKYFSPRSTM